MTCLMNSGDFKIALHLFIRKLLFRYTYAFRRTRAPLVVLWKSERLFLKTYSKISCKQKRPQLPFLKILLNTETCNNRYNVLFINALLRILFKKQVVEIMMKYLVTECLRLLCV